MDVVLVGLPGTGKSAVARRLAARHGAHCIDLDRRIEELSGTTVEELFRRHGEGGFREWERRAVAELPPPEDGARLRLVVATGGGAVVDPRNRWLLYRRRLPLWLDGDPGVLLHRLRRSPVVRPLLAGATPEATLHRLAASRRRFYAAAPRIDATRPLAAVVAAVEARLDEGPRAGTLLLRAETRIGEFWLGEGILGPAVAAILARLEARRAVVISEPTAWEVAGPALRAALVEAGLPIHEVLLPAGEAAKGLAVIQEAARRLAALRVERGEPLVAVGGGALTDAAGFLAAIWQRGTPILLVPTTLVGQLDAAIGGKTAVDLPEGKNLLGAFHQPAAVVIDVAVLRTLPQRERRAALGEAVKMALLGDEALFRLLEAEGDAIARGDDGAWDDGAVAELVERAAWAKVETVLADERETAGSRIRLNLGHTVGHALEAADGYRHLLHGEAVAHGLLAALWLGERLGVTPPERARRARALLDRLGLAQEPLPYPAGDVLTALGRDKKHAGGRLRWVLPTADGTVVRDDVAEELVAEAVAVALAGGRDEGGTGGD
jgi:3-dehydroquinate synthetase/shikimate kinase